MIPWLRGKSCLGYTDGRTDGPQRAWPWSTSRGAPGPPPWRSSCSSRRPCLLRSRVCHCSLRSCGRRADAGTAIRFTLDRKIDGPAAPFFLAIDKGYFKAEGLDVTIDAATGGPLEAIDRLATARLRDGGRRHQPSHQVPRCAIPARRSRPLFTVFDKPPYAIIARKSRGIVAPTGFGRAKSSAHLPPIATFAAWPIFAKVAGIDAAKVAIESVGLAGAASRCWLPARSTPSPASPSPPTSI